MPATLRFYLVDAFAERPFRGNVAGVVFEADALNAVQMQQIAGEIHASETAFLSRLGDLHRPARIRWFTPTTEVGFCGHATLAAAHVLDDAGCLPGLSRPDSSLILESAAGTLRLQREPQPEAQPALWWLEMPDPALKADQTDLVRTCALLGIGMDDLDTALPAMRSRDDDVIFIVRRVQTLLDMRPNFGELAPWCEHNRIRGLCAATTATLAKSINVHSRFFAPAVGVNEDPVTGSVHGPLAVYLVANKLVRSVDDRAALLCAQGRPADRSGLVRALVEATPRGYRVRIGGQCFTTLTGELRVPPE